jgi:beta-glucosidase
MSELVLILEGFLRGTASASYQIEGTVDEDGRAPSIWDTFCHTPGKVFHGYTGDVACEQYHLSEQDVALMAELRLNAYRLSVVWPRVQPSDFGVYNQVGLDFYHRLLDGLVERGTAPVVTLQHWDLPQALHDSGGWANRDAAQRFADHAHGVVEAPRERVSLWINLNESWVSAFLGYGLGDHAPGVADLTSAVCAAHRLLLGHGLAAGAVRSAMAPASRVGVTLSLSLARPTSGSEADAEAAIRVDGYANRWFLDPLFRGSYPRDLAEVFLPGDRGRACPPVRPRHGQSPNPCPLRRCSTLCPFEFRCPLGRARRALRPRKPRSLRVRLRHAYRKAKRTVPGVH